MEIHDLVLSKLAAGRPHDLEFAATAIRSSLVDREQLVLGVELVPEKARAAVSTLLDGLLARLA
jgi:hypothetical protein